MAPNVDTVAEVGAASEIAALNAVEIKGGWRNVYRVECHGADGKLKWVEERVNLVTTEGKNDVLTKYFKGSSYTAGWYVGLINNAGFSALAAGDTAAQIGGSNGWTEATTYSESVRQTLTLGSASAGSIDNSASKATFSINGTVTIYGIFVVSTSTKSGTTGVLYGEVAFGSTRALSSEDTLTVTVTLTQS
jgi:hypothetical protein